MHVVRMEGDRSPKSPMSPGPSPIRGRLRNTFLEFYVEDAGGSDDDSPFSPKSLAEAGSSFRRSQSADGDFAGRGCAAHEYKGNVKGLKVTPQLIPAPLRVKGGADKKSSESSTNSVGFGTSDSASGTLSPTQTRPRVRWAEERPEHTPEPNEMDHFDPDAFCLSSNKDEGTNSLPALRRRKKLTEVNAGQLPTLMGTLDVEPAQGGKIGAVGQQWAVREQRQDDVESYDGRSPTRSGRRRNAASSTHSSPSRSQRRGRGKQRSGKSEQGVFATLGLNHLFHLPHPSEEPLSPPAHRVSVARGSSQAVPPPTPVQTPMNQTQQPMVGGSAGPICGPSFPPMECISPQRPVNTWTTDQASASMSPTRPHPVNTNMAWEQQPEPCSISPTRPVPVSMVWAQQPMSQPVSQPVSPLKPHAVVAWDAPAVCLMAAPAAQPMPTIPACVPAWDPQQQQQSQQPPHPQQPQQPQLQQNQVPQQPQVPVAPECTGVSSTVVLSNIMPRLTHKQVTNLLDIMGLGDKYDYVHVPMDATHTANLGCAYVNFINAAVAEQAMQTLAGCRLGGSEEPILVGLAQWAPGATWQQQPPQHLQQQPQAQQVQVPQQQQMPHSQQMNMQMQMPMQQQQQQLQQQLFQLQQQRAR